MIVTDNVIEEVQSERSLSPKKAVKIQSENIEGSGLSESLIDKAEMSEISEGSNERKSETDIKLPKAESSSKVQSMHRLHTVGIATLEQLSLNEE